MNYRCNYRSSSVKLINSKKYHFTRKTNLERESLDMRLGLGLLEYRLDLADPGLALLYLSDPGLALLDLSDPGLALLVLDIGLGLLESLSPSDLVVEWTLDFLDGDWNFSSNLEALTKFPLMVMVVLAESVTDLGLVFLTLLLFVFLAGTLEDRFCLNGFSPPPPG